MLAGRDSCLDLADHYEPVLSTIWRFNTKYIGNAGTRALFERAIHIAERQNPLVHKIQTSGSGVRFDELLYHLQSADCDSGQVADAFLALIDSIFATLAELTGDTIVQPLYRVLVDDLTTDAATSRLPEATSRPEFGDANSVSGERTRHAEDEGQGSI
jgi:hypothetical protein